MTYLKSITIKVSIPYWCDWKFCAMYGISPLILFQFLIGAIGSGCFSFIFMELIMFQFLIGAIGSLRRGCFRLVMDCFNSLLVRLEEGGRNLDDESDIRFNSLLVRLEV